MQYQVAMLMRITRAYKRGEWIACVEVSETQAVIRIRLHIYHMLNNPTMHASVIALRSPWIPTRLQWTGMTVARATPPWLHRRTVGNSVSARVRHRQRKAL